MKHHGPQASRRGARRISRALSSVALLALLWLVWPQSLHGDVAYVKVDGHSMDPTMHLGDLAILRHQGHYAIGDVISYRIPRGQFGAGAQVIHRIVGGDGSRGFIMKGDNKPLPDPWHPRQADVVGKEWIHIPRAGNWVEVLARPINLAGLCAALTVVVMMISNSDEDSEPTAPRKSRHRVA